MFDLYITVPFVVVLETLDLDNEVCRQQQQQQHFFECTKH